MLRSREEATGGGAGIVLNLTMSGDGIWDVAYSVKVLVGNSEQPLMLSVDTGSSDLWIASRSCSTPPCSDAHTSLYDQSSSRRTPYSLNLTFLRGSVSGPIVWDSLTIGPYKIPSQALAAADRVSDEVLSSEFVGLIGLALPPSSEIARLIPPTESDEPDGATLQMNLFGLSPDAAAPTQRFISLSLERPGTTRIPSLLGIGRHPSNLIPGFDPSKITYAELIPSREGDTFWRVPIMDITAWVDGVAKPIQLKRSVALPTSVYSVALVDSGGPSILANVDIANGIYGAWGIGPGQDGNYYVPCATPMNISFRLANLPPIPVHPLDVTAPPQASMASVSSSAICMGQIQPIPSNQLVGIADIVLGVPFLRNVYAVLSSSSSDDANSSVHGSPNPRLGLVPLTDPNTALSEFHTVRVLGQPLGPALPTAGQRPPMTVGKKLSVGLTVLVSIIGFFVACTVLFGARWWIMRRRFKRGPQAGRGEVEWAHEKDKQLDVDVPREQWAAGNKKNLFYRDSSTGSDVTHAEQNYGIVASKEEVPLAKLLSRPESRSSLMSEVACVHGSPGLAAPEPDGRGPTHFHTDIEADPGGGLASATPLLTGGEYSPWSDTSPTHGRPPSLGSVTFVEENSMAGVGTRSSTASSSQSSRPRSRPRGARAQSVGSIPSVASRMWHAEVGEVLELVDVSQGS